VRIYYPEPGGGGVYYLDQDGDTYTLMHLPRYPDGQVAWDMEGSTGEVVFDELEPEYREGAYEAAKWLCAREGLSPAMVRQVLGIE
jgi:hypothetical protein